MNKKGIIIYLVMKGQDEFVEKAKTYFQKSSYLLEVIEINDWQDELSFESKTGKALFHTIETIKQKNLSNVILVVIHLQGFLVFMRCMN